MKNKIFKTAMMAVVALTLMAGSAFAAKIEVCKEVEDMLGPVEECKWLMEPGSRIVFGGLGDPRLAEAGNFNSIYGILLNDIPDLYNPPAGSRGYVTAGSPSGTFAEYIPPTAGWGVADNQFTYVPAFPNPEYIGFDFRDVDTLDWLVEFRGISGTYAGLEFGTVEGFTFWIGEIDPEHSYLLPVGNNAMFVNVVMYGQVSNDELYWAADAMYTFVLHSTDLAANTWSWSMDVRILDNPPEVPEPGTLVLLGTGLLGAAIVARKKMAKK